VPREDLARFGVDLTERRATPGFVELMDFEIDRCRRLYRSADAGLEYLPPRSARCIRLAGALYEGILDRIEHQGNDVFAARARVPRVQKVRLVATALLRH
jgi:phytoene synthase